MTEREDRIDQVLSEYARRCMEDFEPRSTEEMWERFAKRLATERRGRTRRSLTRWVAGVAALFVMVTGMSLLVMPEQVRAIGKKMVIVQTVLMDGPQGNIRISVRDPHREGQPPPPDDGPVALEQVRDRVPFSVLLPSHIPDGYDLVGHTYQETGPALGELTTDYVGHGLFIVVRQSNSAYFGSRYGHTIETMVRVSPVAVRGVEATLLERDTDGWVSLSWQDEGIYYAISGRMSPEQVRQMAESLQEA